MKKTVALILSALTALSLFGAFSPVGAGSTSFADVSPTSWYSEAVDYVVSHGLMSGTEPTLFSPNAVMTRAMLVVVLWRFEGSPTGFKNNFRDVADGAWYESASAWAGENGIVSGTGKRRFDPGGSITREQLATIMARYTSYIGSMDGGSSSLSAFSDGDSVSDWARAGMAWAVAHGIITGDKDSKGNAVLVPQGTATRAQAATVLMRYCSNSKYVHEWDAGVKTADPDCTNKGSVVYKCACGAVKTVAISALGHVEKDRTTVKKPTCTESGTDRFYCTRCGKYCEEETDPLGHKWGTGQVTKAPTCTKDGVMTYTCSRCKATAKKSIAKTGHEWEAATCTLPKTCKVCGAEEGSALGHKWTAATCTSPKTCKVCGATDGSALGHKWDEGVVTKAATCTADGIKTFTCTRCGKTASKPVPRAHTFKPATCTKPKTCRVCGATEGSPLGHTETPVCSRCGNKNRSSWVKKLRDAARANGGNWLVASGTKNGIISNGSGYVPFSIRLAFNDSGYFELIYQYKSGSNALYQKNTEIILKLKDSDEMIFKVNSREDYGTYYMVGSVTANGSGTNAMRKWYGTLEEDPALSIVREALWDSLRAIDDCEGAHVSGFLGFSIYK